MNDDKTNTSETADREIVISRLLDAPRELVWKVLDRARACRRVVGSKRLYDDHRGDGCAAGWGLETHHAWPGWH